ncbi:MAG: hypothetical protein C0490_25965 [Marivirga sp.]|nr:hypothetical protein [Marivirga sp.]
MSSKIQLKKFRNIHYKYTNTNLKNYRHKDVNVSGRNIIYGFMFYLLFVAPSYGQQFSLGIKGGPLVTLANFGDKDDKDEFSHEPKLGYYIAGLVSFPLKKDYSFQTEFGFSQKGRKITFNSDTWENDATYFFGDAAMMLRKSFPFNWGRNIPSTWFLNIGPHISYWIEGNGKIDAGGSYKYNIVFTPMPLNPDAPDFDKMYLDNVNRWLFGIDIGVGFAAPLSNKKKISTELRFTSGHTFYGQKNSASNRTLGFTDNLRSNEKVISLTVAYVIDVNVKDNRKGKSTKDKEVSRKRVKRK